MIVESKKIGPFEVLLGLFALFWLMVAFSPLYYMVITTFKEQMELARQGIFAFPRLPNLSNYRNVLSGNFPIYLRNSVLVLVASSLLTLVAASFAAYPFSRMTFRWNKPLYGFVVATMAVPIHMTLIPVFLLTVNMGIYDSIWALIGPYVAFNLPVSVFILSSFMADIPKELEESAAMDGCNKYQTFFHVILPLSKSGLATITIFNGVTMWNEFSFALVLTQSVQNRTLPLGIWDYQGQYAGNVPLIMTMLFLTTLPMIIAFAVGKEKLIKGMMAGAVKG